MIRTDYLRIAPDLDVLVTWSSRMSEALHRRYHRVMHGELDASEFLCQSYARWCQAQNAAFDQIHRFYKLTNSLPVAGDGLSLAYSDGGQELRIEQRQLFTTLDPSPMLLVYYVCADEIEDLEEYQEGDYVDEDDEEVN